MKQHAKPWTKLAGENSDAGFRAAWLLAKKALLSGNYSMARNLVMGQQRLANHIFGREIIARVTLLEGDEQGAIQLYYAIEAESAEAKMVLALRASERKQWAEALRLKRRLLADFPDWTHLEECVEKLEQLAQGNQSKVSHR